MIHTILAEHMYLKIYMYNLSCASIMLQQHCFYPNNGFTFMLALYMYTCSNLDFLRHAKRHNLCKGKVKCWPSITNTIGFCFKIFVSDNCDEPTIRFLRKYWRRCTVCHFDSIERNWNVTLLVLLHKYFVQNPTILMDYSSERWIY